MGFERGKGSPPLGKVKFVGFFEPIDVAKETEGLFSSLTRNAAVSSEITGKNGPSDLGLQPKLAERTGGLLHMRGSILAGVDAKTKIWFCTMHVAATRGKSFLMGRNVNVLTITQPVNKHNKIITVLREYQAPD